MTLGIYCQSPTYGAQVLVGGNDSKEASDIVQKVFKRDLAQVVVTELGVGLGGDGPKLLSMVLFPETTDEAGFYLCVKPGSCGE